MSRLVSAADLEACLEDLRRSIPAKQYGLYSPDSISWKVNRESALFLAAGRAALLQLAHPWVAAAIAQHSRTLNDPVGRFHQTFRIMFTMSFGSVDQAFAAARGLHRLHETIRGILPDAVGRFAERSGYQANEADALCWVYATLIDSSVLAYELLLPQLSASEREQYYLESRRTAALFGLPTQSLPQSWAAFAHYVDSTLRSDSLGVSSATRQIAHQLMEARVLGVQPPVWYRALTTEVLLPRFREEFQFEYGERERRAAARAVKWLRRIYPHLPALLRFVGPANEVESYLRGRRRVGLAIALSNRLWIGSPSLQESAQPGIVCDPMPHRAAGS